MVFVLDEDENLIFMYVFVGVNSFDFVIFIIGIIFIVGEINFESCSLYLLIILVLDGIMMVIIFLIVIVNDMNDLLMFFNVLYFLIVNEGVLFFVSIL